MCYQKDKRHTEAMYHYCFQILEAFKFKAKCPTWFKSLNDQVVNKLENFLFRGVYTTS